MQAIGTAAKTGSQTQQTGIDFGQLVGVTTALSDPPLATVQDQRAAASENERDEQTVPPHIADDWYAWMKDGLFDYMVAVEKMLTDETIARFHRPDLEDPSMLWGSPEFFRWYYADGESRKRPLDYDELIELICFRDQCSTEDAEREVSLNSRARQGDQKVWKLIHDLGYADYIADFAQGVYGVS